MYDVKIVFGECGVLWWEEFLVDEVDECIVVIICVFICKWLELLICLSDVVCVVGGEFWCVWMFDV